MIDIHEWKDTRTEGIQGVQEQKQAQIKESQLCLDYCEGVYSLTPSLHLGVFLDLKKSLLEGPKYKEYQKGWVGPARKVNMIEDRKALSWLTQLNSTLQQGCLFTLHQPSVCLHLSHSGQVHSHRQRFNSRIQMFPCYIFNSRSHVKNIYLKKKNCLTSISLSLAWVCMLMKLGLV